MKITFLHGSKSYLPELVAYQDYFLSKGFQVTDSNKNEFDLNTDIVWRFMGVGRTYKSKFNIHEHGSLSTGRVPKIKDFIKHFLLGKPDARIFLNKYVKDRLAFSDGVPHTMRDMGVHKSFFGDSDALSKDHDFIYVGSITRSRQIEKICHIFRYRMKDRTLSLIGTPDDEIYKSYKNVENIRFLGRVDYLDIGEICRSARYGLNYTPMSYPFSHQTSTKLLEYCASKLKVVSTGGFWVEQFMRERAGRFYILDPQLNNFDTDRIDSFDFLTPDVSDLEWNVLLNRIGLAEWLQNLTGLE